MSADCLLYCQLIVYFCQLFVYIFVSWFQLFIYFCQLKSAVCLLFVSWFQLIVYILNFCAKIMVFWSLFCHYRCFNTLLVKNKKKSALCLQFSCLFTFCQLISADCLHFEFLRQNHGFLVTFLPLQMLQHFACKR